MKKLIMAIAVAALSASAMAATADWKLTTLNVYVDGSTSTKYSGTAYIYDANALAQSALFTDFQTAYNKSETYNFASTAKASLTLENGKQTSANTFSYGNVGSDYSLYFVVLSDDSKALYFSNILEDMAGVGSPDVGALAFKSQNNGTTTFSGTARADGFQGAGKWSSVPEPTSAMLLMLGLCGLALKRKNA